MDFDRMDYLPIVDRPRLLWPGNARVAFWVAPNIEHYEYLPKYDGKRDPWPRCPYPDVQGYAHFDYGNRVGFWRLLEVLDRHGIRPTASLNLAVLHRYPEIAEAMLKRDWDLMSHGRVNTEYVNTLSEEEEREFLLDNMRLFEKYTGRRLNGFFGPSSSSTERTPDLLAELGFTYHCDFVHDDQPMPIRVRSGRLISVPYSFETNDGPVLRTAGAGDYFVEVCKRQFDRLYEEGTDGGRVMCIAVHPCWIGQPHRITCLDQILSYILGHEDVWLATADEIAKHFMVNYYDRVVAHARNLGAAGGAHGR